MNYETAEFIRMLKNVNAIQVLYYLEKYGRKV